MLSPNSSTSYATQGQSFGQRLGTGGSTGASRTSGGAVVSPSSGGTSNVAAFSGTGHAVGGTPPPYEQSTSPRTGVPANSRLLQQNTQPPERPAYDDTDNEETGDTV